jgi:hypothetical protein
MKGNVDAVYCEFKYSGVADGFLLAAAIATLALLAALPFAPALEAALAVLVAALACKARAAIRAVGAVRIDGGGTVLVQGRDGNCRTGCVRDGSFVAPWLTLVRWRPHGSWRDRSVLILPGMLEPDDFRRLRVVLRWG